MGAEQGYIYVRGEYPLAIRRLETGIRQARGWGSWARRSSSPRSISGSISGSAPAPSSAARRPRSWHRSRAAAALPGPAPPYPAASGLWGNPTLINNVETFANIPPIIRNGPEWFAAIGTEKSKGAKVFALAGKIKNTGLVEVPMGTTLWQIVEEIGGGAGRGEVQGRSDRRALRRLHSGRGLDTPVDYDSLVQLGSIMGSDTM